MPFPRQKVYSYHSLLLIAMAKIHFFPKMKKVIDTSCLIQTFVINFAKLKNRLFR